jgi:hypothetical protein
MVRFSTRFGFGIRPSRTIASNSGIETPMYSAARLRRWPRGHWGKGFSLILYPKACIRLMNDFPHRIVYGPLRTDRTTIKSLVVGQIHFRPRVSANKG